MIYRPTVVWHRLNSTSIIDYVHVLKVMLGLSCIDGRLGLVLGLSTPFNWFGCTNCRRSERQKCHSDSQNVYGSEKEFYGSTFLGTWLLCVYGWCGWANDPRLYQTTGVWRPSPWSTEYFRGITTFRWFGISDRFERLTYTSLRLCRRSWLLC